MLNRADLFALYIEFYNKWFLLHGASLDYVKGDLYKYKRNIICVYSESQIKSLVLAKSAYFTRRNDIPCFCLVGSRYVLEGADIDKDCQYIFYSDEANDNITLILYLNRSKSITYIKKCLYILNYKKLVKSLIFSNFANHDKCKLYENRTRPIYGYNNICSQEFGCKVNTFLVRLCTGSETWP